MTCVLKNLRQASEADLRARVVPKGDLPTRLDRAKAKKKARAHDDRKLRAWATRVKKLDGWTDRHTGRRVVKTDRAVPDRAEAHHIAPRSDRNVRYDVRNGITLSWETHARVERNELEIVGTVFFTVEGKRYIDGRHPVVFKERKDRHGRPDARA